MGVPARALPSPNTDNAALGIANRAGRYGEQYVRTPADYYADEGTYFLATNPTIGTGVANSAATGFVATTPFLTLFNNNALTGGARVQLDYLKLICTVAGAGGSTVGYAFLTDTGNRFTSGGSAITPVNVNRDSTNSTNSVVNAGAITATAATASRLLGHDNTLRSTIIIVNDKFYFDFSNKGPAALGPQAATLSNFYVAHPPVFVGPQQSVLFYLWMTGGAASSFEFEFGYSER